MVRKDEKIYRYLVDNALVGVYRSDLKGNILYANEALARMFEFSSPEEMMSEGALARYQEPQDRAVWIEALKRSGKLEGFEAEMVTKTGAQKTVLFNATLEGDVISGMAVDITDRKRAEHLVEQQIERLAALREVDRAITGSLDLRVTLDVILEKVTALLGVDAAAVLLFDPHQGVLEEAARRGFRASEIGRFRVRLGEGCAGRAALERHIVHILDVRGNKEDSVSTRRLDGEEFISQLATPLMARGEVRGVLEIFHRGPLDPDEEWLNFLEALSTQAAIAIDNAQLFEDLQRSKWELSEAYDTTLEGWSRALGLRDDETEGHAERVIELTLRLARAMGVSGGDMTHIRRGVLLHDIGKIGVPDRILLKPGPLSDEEREIMQQHPVIAYELLSPIRFLRPALDIPYCHHEKWDGSGYPRGLKGEEIPLAARIFAVVDVWDALRSDRPYRKAWSDEKALGYIQDQAGHHFDPRVVEVFLEMLKESSLLPGPPRSETLPS